MISPRSRRACDTCRERKTKCDRALPSCGRCKRLGELCSYDSRRAAPNNLISAQIIDLQERLLRAEAQLASSRSSLAPLQPAPPPQPCYTPLTTQSTNHASFCLSTLQFTAPSVDNSNANQNVQNVARDDHPLYTSATGRLPTPSIVMDRQPAPEPTTISLDNDQLGMDLEWIPDYQFPAFEAPLDLLDLAGQRQLTPSASDSDALSMTELSALHGTYSRVLYNAHPFLNFERLQRDLAADPDSIPTLALSHSVALVGSTLLPEYRHLTATCYNLARRYIESCERDETGEHLVCLSLLQAIIFVIRYEITDRHLRRDYMTLGRAIRLMKVLGLHTQDSESPPDPRDAGDLGMCLPASDDALVLEERRRTFWTLYILESYFTTRTGIPGELSDAKAFSVRLPAPGNLDSSFQHISMPQIGHAADPLIDPRTSIRSSFAGCILMVELALECFSHARRRYQNGVEADGFWDNHYRLLKSFNDRAVSLDQYVEAEAVQRDPISLSIQLNLCASEIFFYQTAIQEAERQGLPKYVADESRRLGVEAAFRIVRTIEARLPSSDPQDDVFHVQATFVAWPLTMALKALSSVLESSLVGLPHDAMANSIRLLKGALDSVEPSDGHWHSLTAPLEAKLLRLGATNRESSLILK